MKNRVKWLLWEVGNNLIKIETCGSKISNVNAFYASNENNLRRLHSESHFRHTDSDTAETEIV